MIITLTIYALIILYVIGRGFSTSIKKPLCNVQKIESFQNSISLGLMPFYSNMGKINLFAFFINLLFLSFISLSLLPDLISNTVVHCQDSDSSSDSDNGKSIIHYVSENDIYAKNINREEEIRREEEGCFFIKHGLNYYYPNDYEGIYKKTIEETYRISNYKFPYIHLLNSFSNFGNDNSLQINDYLKVFQGFSKDVENLIEKQNNLVQKITPIDKHSFKIIRIRDMFSEINNRSIDTLVLTSYAYDNLMDSLSEEDINRRNSSESRFGFLPFESSNDSEDNFDSKECKFLNESEKNNQINILNEKITKIFNSLEIIQKISEENSNNLDKLISSPKKFEDLNLKINKDNILIIQDTYNLMLEESQIKTSEELYNYYKTFDKKNSDGIYNINCNKIETILYNIKDFYKSKIFIRNPQQIIDKGFILKDINQYCDESFIDSDNAFNVSSSESSGEEGIFNFNWEHTDIY